MLPDVARPLTVMIAVDGDNHVFLDDADISSLATFAK